MFASPTNSILATKIHHNLAVRCLCEPRINEIRILIENKQLDFNSIVFHVLPHRTIPDNFEVVKGNQTFAAYLQLKSLKKPVPSTLKCRVYEKNSDIGPLEIALNASKTKNEQP
uniref:Uncharacterized protein n=1 Tax=Panagrolaimus sp. ES5 TaxID=591445 RepID=A0AC34GJG4_9BILA